ncbi:hypothetical protein [Alkalihalobacterium chitinilyticum]|uniref:DUF945 family protein n=1 Tax=Alkalihalobacterium chitinilyticum TaxID=2980103 RepID=A0ABT5VIJ2_9BACI|nr:hypothetical protein [Alkalihalobacterium chitinilyticum]MDE5415271.1 hypothetical protein [Alkalihalobacterium chitinilyticum]
MESKGTKIGIGIGSLLILIIGGILFYSFSSSPEVKLARAIINLSEEDKVQVTSGMNMSVDVDWNAHELGLYGEEEIFFEIMQSLLKNISGTSSMIWDSENKVMEMNATYGISGDIQGETIDLQMPFSLYIDENNDEIAFDLDPYVNFTSDIIDIISYNILPNIPDLQEELAYFTDGQDIGEFVSTELNTFIVPIIEDAIRGKKYTEPLDIDGKMFREDDERYLYTFVFEKMLEYMKDNSEEEIVTEEDNWISLSLEEELLFDSLIYAMKEVEKDEEAKAAYEESGEQDIETTIRDLEDTSKDLEDVSLLLTGSFLVEKNIIKESKFDFSLTFEEDGQKINMSGTVNSEYVYGVDTEFSFYGKDRQAITEAELDDIGYQIELALEDYMMELMADNFDYEHDFELTDEEKELIAALEASEVTHTDFGMTSEEMYQWVLALELEGLVKSGTSDLYMPDL